MKHDTDELSYFSSSLSYFEQASRQNGFNLQCKKLIAHPGKAGKNCLRLAKRKTAKN
jgi:hypothetical protein